MRPAPVSAFFALIVLVGSSGCGIAAQPASSTSVSGTGSASTPAISINQNGIVYASAFPSLQAAYESLPMPAGGTLVLPCGDVRFSQTWRLDSRPVIVIGCGATLGRLDGGNAGTRLVWTGGPGVAIDLGGKLEPGFLAGTDDTRGSILRDFTLDNEGAGTVGIRINTQEPRLINVYVFPVSSGSGKAFADSAIMVGDLGEVNDFLCRDCYIRKQNIALKLLQVSEGTIDHSRIVDSSIAGLQLGDATHTAGNVIVTNGTAIGQYHPGQVAIKVVRAPYRLVLDKIYCEAEGDGLCLDATSIVGHDLDNLVIRDSYFARARQSADYAIAIDSPNTELELSGNTFRAFRVAAVHNLAVHGALVTSNSLLGGTPQLLSSEENAALYSAAGIDVPRARIHSGVHPDGGGLKHKRLPGCSATAAAKCDTPVIWDTPFADTNYTVTCSFTAAINDASVEGITNKTAGQVTVRIATQSSDPASGTVECIAIHD